MLGDNFETFAWRREPSQRRACDQCHLGNRVFGIAPQYAGIHSNPLAPTFLVEVLCGQRGRHELQVPGQIVNLYRGP